MYFFSEKKVQWSFLFLWEYAEITEQTNGDMESICFMQ